MKSNLILIGSIVLALAVIGLAFFVLKPQETVTLPLLVEEYADYNCPHCKDFIATTDQLKKDFAGDLNFVFIPHPILGSSAQQAVFAAEAARKQGKFAEYGSQLFADQTKRSDEDFVKIAKDLGLNVAQFNKDRESQEIQDLVINRLEENTGKGIVATPTVYINGKKVVSLDYESLKKLISEKIELAKKQQNENS